MKIYFLFAVLFVTISALAQSLRCTVKSLRRATTGIACNANNEFLLERVLKRALSISPPVYDDGKPRKLNAMESITIVKK